MKTVLVKKIFHFDSPRDPYECDAAIVWCFDHRFDLGFRKFLQRSGVVNPDPIKIAGGARCLSSPAVESDREFVIEQIRTSIRLHNTRRVILMLHSDCGAYGGLAAFQNDAAAERLHHRAELRRAVEALRAAIPNLTIDPYFVDFEGVWTLDETTADTAAAH